MAKGGSKLLTEVESKELLKQAGIPVIETRLARSKKEAVSISRELGFPVVLKISSPSIIHKSDFGGVRLGLSSALQVANAYHGVISSIKQKYPEAIIQGVTVQKMAQPGVEVIMGMSKDPQFGPIIMFGLGGILVEILKDVSFRIVPVTQRDASEMIREIKGYPLLQGYRREPVNVTALEKIIIMLSEFAEQNPQIKEADLNPVFAYKDRAVTVDARLILDCPTGKQSGIEET